MKIQRMGISKTLSVWLLSATVALASNGIPFGSVTANTVNRHDKEPARSLRRNSQRNRRNEEQDDDQADDDGNSAFYFEEGYIAGLRCSSYKVEESEDSNTEVVLKWNAAYGNGLDFFRVAQKSFVFYEYIDDSTKWTKATSNRGDRNAFTYITDLDSWLEVGATLELGNDADAVAPSCRQMDNAPEIFQTNNNQHDDITRYFSISSNQYNNYFGDWEPQLYVGPICGMGDGALNWGVFLDDTCTTYVPKWTYRYRTALGEGQISNRNDTNALLEMDAYTEPQTSRQLWSCENGDGLCDTLFSYSADTLYCAIPDADADADADGDADGDENEDRRLEEDGDDAVNDDAYVYANANADDDYFALGYQLGQDDLEDIETECASVFQSHLYNGDLTLEEYLKNHGQLKRTKDYNARKQMKSIISFSVLTLLLFIIVVSATMVVRQQQKRKQVTSTSIRTDTENDKENDDDKRNTSTKSKNSGDKNIPNTIKMASLVGIKTKKDRKGSTKTKTKPQRAVWFRRKKAEAKDDDKQESLLDFKKSRSSRRDDSELP